MKLFLILLLIYAAAYITGCSSAEQTTGMLAYQQQDYAKAEVEFMKELNRNPSNEEALFYLGASRLFLNKYEKADSAFRAYRKIGKNSYKDQVLESWNTRYNAGAEKYNKAQQTKDTQEQIKLYNEAATEFKVALILLPDSTIVQKYIDNINNKIGLISVNPMIEAGVKFMKEADSLQRADLYPEAINEFTKAMNTGISKDNSAYEILTIDLGLAYAKWAVRLQKDNPDDTASYKPKYRAALPYLEELTSSKDKSNQLIGYESLVGVYANLGMTDKATEAIKKRDELKAELNK